MEEKLPYDLKNWCKAKIMKKCLINKTCLIKYNQLKLRIEVHELINNRNKYSSITFQVKYIDGLIVRLKTIKSREDTFCYLSFYLYCSFF